MLRFQLQPSNTSTSSSSIDFSTPSTSVSNSIISQNRTHTTSSTLVSVKSSHIIDPGEPNSADDQCDDATHSEGESPRQHELNQILFFGHSSVHDTNSCLTSIKRSESEPDLFSPRFHIPQFIR